jgi:hypothetical protein
VTQLYVEVGGNAADTGAAPGSSEVRTCPIADTGCGGLVVAGGAGATGSSFVVAHALTGDVGTDTTGVPRVTITPGPSIEPGELPLATAGAPYSQQLTAQHGGVATDASFVLSAGALPDGVTLSPDGLVAGTPATPGSFAFTVDARDSFGFVGRLVSSVEVAVAVAPPPVAEPSPEHRGPDAATPEADTPTTNEAASIEPETLPGGHTGDEYSEQLSVDVDGSPADATYSLLRGALPPGLTLSDSGLIAGTPTAAGPYEFTIKASIPDVGGVRRVYTVSIAGVRVAPPSLPSAVVDLGYFQRTFLTRDGHEVHQAQFSVLKGELPRGVTLAPSGAIGGIPKKEGTFRFTVEGIARGGSTAEHRYKIVVTPPPPPPPPSDPGVPTDPTVPGVPDFPDGLFDGLDVFGEGDPFGGAPTVLTLADLGINLSLEELGLDQLGLDLLGGDLGFDLLAETGTTTTVLFWFGAGLVLVGGMLLLVVPKSSRRPGQARRSTV